MLRHDELPGELAEPIRTIINRYELREQAPLPSRIAVTATVDGEGVTTISQALAAIVAHEMGATACWVDCSWLRGERSGSFVHGRPGLTDLLERPLGVLSALQSSPDQPRLMCLEVGPVAASRRNTIVRSPEFQQIIDVLADHCDHLIFDIPPVLSHASGLGLLRQSDASIFVVRQRTTTTSQFRRLVEATQPTPNIGVVLNRYRTHIPRFLRSSFGD